MQQRARRLAHALEVPGPDRHAQQHDVGRREAGHRQAAQQLLLLLIVGVGGRARVEGRELVAQGGDLGGQGVGARDGSGPGEMEAPCREIDAAGGQVGFAGQRLFDLGHAARAVDALDQQVELVPAVLVAHVGGEVEARLLFGGAGQLDDFVGGLGHDLTPRS